MSGMADDQFTVFKDSLKIVSDIEFKRFIKKERDAENKTTPDYLLNMLSESVYFSDLFFRGFIEGINFEKKLNKDIGELK